MSNWLAVNRPDCVYVYQWSSTGTHGTPSGTYPAAATITWTRVWSCEPACGNGDLGPLPRTANFPLTVHQAQAVITRAP